MPEKRNYVILTIYYDDLSIIKFEGVNINYLYHATINCINVYCGGREYELPADHISKIHEERGLY